MLEMFDPLADGKAAPDGEYHQGHDKAPEKDLITITKRMDIIGRLFASPDTH